ANASGLSCGTFDGPDAEFYRGWVLTHPKLVDGSNLAAIPSGMPAQLVADFSDQLEYSVTNYPVHRRAQILRQEAVDTVVYDAANTLGIAAAAIAAARQSLGADRAVILTGTSSGSVSTIAKGAAAIP